jgi:hypothetical protein
MSLLRHESQAIINKAITDGKAKQLLEVFIDIIDWQEAVISGFSLSIPSFWLDKAEKAKQRLFTEFQAIAAESRGGKDGQSNESDQLRTAKTDQIEQKQD